MSNYRKKLFCICNIKSLGKYRWTAKLLKRRKTFLQTYKSGYCAWVIWEKGCSSYKLWHPRMMKCFYFSNVSKQKLFVDSLTYPYSHTCFVLKPQVQINKIHSFIVSEDYVKTEIKNHRSNTNIPIKLQLCIWITASCKSGLTWEIVYSDMFNPVIFAFQTYFLWCLSYWKWNEVEN